ncbi:MAG: histidine--tRNA ligase [Phycisphaerales bacterium]|nr:histidine--tRNA ligase [Phycisphaerales bacterium]
MAEKEGKRGKKFQGPKGTRDFYPREMARRRYIERAWRKVAIRHGFDEIEGPTFESSDLYAVKSGEGILGELFQAFSGKSPEEVEQVKATGRAPYALRPEFTPTLARMFADRAASLPRPTKWFAIPLHYRAERPQRGRLREFLQWNVDVIGDDSPAADAEVIAAAIALFRELGLESKHLTVRLSNRDLVSEMLQSSGVAEADLQAALTLLDRRDRMPAEQFDASCAEIGLDSGAFIRGLDQVQSQMNEALAALESGRTIPPIDRSSPATAGLVALLSELAARAILRWCEFDFSIVRGLAYYTGTVFEITAQGQRAIAGGGRYDRLIEMFGGPPTPAVGFGMGDVVLSLVLEESGLMPDEEMLAEHLNTRPDAFVISTGGTECDAAVVPLVAELQRAGLHARRSYKSTSKVEKLLKDAASCFARTAIIIDDEYSAGTVSVKDFTDGRQHILKREELLAWIRQRRAAKP